MELLERSDQLSALADVARRRHRRGGRDARPRRRRGGRREDRPAAARSATAGATRRGSSGARARALLTPGPLGPLFDVAEVTRGELEELVSREAPAARGHGALIRELAGGRPTVLVLEDLHWADEATLDVLRLLARKVRGRARARPRQLPRRRARSRASAHARARRAGHDARRSRGSWSRRSRRAGRRRAGRAARDRRAASSTARRTATRSTSPRCSPRDTGEIPPTVRDAVLARVARLSRARAQPARGDRDRDPAGRGLAARGARARRARPPRGVPGVGDGRLPARRRRLPSRARPPGRRGGAGAPPPGRAASRGAPRHSRRSRAAARTRPASPITPTSRATGRRSLRFAPAAAARAASLGAHREAAAQYARALRFADALPPEEQAELLERRAYERYLIGELDAAIAAQERALAHRRALGDPLSGGRLPALALAAVPLPRPHRGRRRGRPPGGRPPRGTAPRARAGARLRQPRAPLHDRRRTPQQAMAWSAKALALGEQLDDAQVLAYALTNIGAVEVFADAPQAPAQLERSLELALRAGLRGARRPRLLNLVWWPLRGRRYDLVDRHLDAGLEYCAERGLDLWRLFLVACRARLELDRGRWTAGGRLRRPRRCAIAAPGRCRACSRSRCSAWSGPGAAIPTSGPLLDEALALAEPTGELQRLGPVAAARAEAAWLEGAPRGRGGGDRGRAASSPLRRQAPWAIGELAALAPARRGGRGRSQDASRRPTRPSWPGDGERAAELWTGLGCPYEAALALAGADDDGAACAWPSTSCSASAPSPRRRSSRRRLRERGVRGLPRGPRATTRENPAGLTAREVEVLALVGAGAAQRRHRGAAVPLGEDRRPSRLGDPAQARRAHARRGERRGSAARHRAPRSVAARSQSRDDVRCGGAGPLVRSSSIRSTRGGHDVREVQDTNRCDAGDRGRRPRSPRRAPARARPIGPPTPAAASHATLPAPHTATRIVEVRASGFDWGDAGLGAAGMLSLLGVGAGALVVARRDGGHRAVR